jgi:hypothetical protein
MHVAHAIAVTTKIMLKIFDSFFICYLLLYITAFFVICQTAIFIQLKIFFTTLLLLLDNLWDKVLSSLLWEFFEASFTHLPIYVIKTPKKDSF